MEQNSLTKDLKTVEKIDLLNKTSDLDMKLSIPSFYGVFIDPNNNSELQIWEKIIGVNYDNILKFKDSLEDELHYNNTSIEDIVTGIENSLLGPLFEKHLNAIKTKDLSNAKVHKILEIIYLKVLEIKIKINDYINFYSSRDNYELLERDYNLSIGDIGNKNLMFSVDDGEMYLIDWVNT